MGEMITVLTLVTIENIYLNLKTLFDIIYIQILEN